MKLFNRQGMMLFPNPLKKSELCKPESLIVIKECFCQNGHNLMNDRAVFNGFSGITLKVKKGKKSGIVALSPVYGYKTRICLDVKLKAGEKWQVLCPTCDEPLSVFSKCTCEGDRLAIFLNKKTSFANCILICNRIDCFNAEIKFNNELIHYSSVDTLI